MLHAILHGKRLGSGIEDKDRNFKHDNAFGAEDILTATVFERISYLPKSILNSFWQNLLPEISGLADEIEFHFWPNLDLDGRRVEPDVIIETPNVLLIVEAKRHDGSQMQMHDQLYRELLACRQYFQNSYEMVLLGIGGMKRYDPEEEAVMEDAIHSYGNDAGEFRFHARSWAGLFRALSEACNSDTEQNTGSSRILADIAQVYQWHGLRTHPLLYLTQIEAATLRYTQFPSLSLGQLQASSYESIHHYLSNLQPIGIRHIHASFGQKSGEISYEQY